AQGHGSAGAGHIDGGEAGLGDGAAGDAVDGAGGHDHLLGGEQLAEIGGVGHGAFLSHLRLLRDNFCPAFAGANSPEPSSMRMVMRSGMASISRYSTARPFWSN